MSSFLNHDSVLRTSRHQKGVSPSGGPTMADLLVEARKAADAAISAAQVGNSTGANKALSRVCAFHKQGKDTGLCARRLRMLQACVDDARAAVSRC